MLSEGEKQELKDLANSSVIREEFRRLRSASRPEAGDAVDLDKLLNFLTVMSRLPGAPVKPRPSVSYTIVRI